MRKNRAIIIPYIFTLGSLALTAKLFAEGRSYPGTGCAIITGIFVFILCIERFLRGREDRIERVEQNFRGVNHQQNNESIENPESYTVVMTSQNCIEVQAVFDALRERGIECTVLDSHSAAMMRFLPEVEMRLMVRGKDYKRSAEIIGDVFGQNASPKDA